MFTRIKPAQFRALTSLFKARATQVTTNPEGGQTTAEYGLVLLAAATLAMLLVAWAGGTDAIGSFFDTIMDKVTSLVAVSSRRPVTFLI